MKKTLLLLASHAAVLSLGFALGVYALPILVAPAAPADAEVAAVARSAQFSGRFVRSLRGSDALHWGEGTVSLAADRIVLAGRVAPGPDYKLYLSPQFVQDADEFKRSKPRMLRVGDVKTFDNFVVAVPPGTDLSAYNTVVVWCESFSMFITAAQYR